MNGPTLVKTKTSTEESAAQLLLPTATEWTPPVKPVAAVQIPYNVAFQEVLSFVTEILNEAGEQWGDQAKQDAVCTILIAASKQRFLTLWQREAA